MLEEDKVSIPSSLDVGSKVVGLSTGAALVFRERCQVRFQFGNSIFQGLPLMLLPEPEDV